MIKMKEWNPMQARLKDSALKADRFSEAVKLCMDMHARLHTSEMSECSSGTFEDDLWEGLSEAVFRIKPSIKDSTIAWNIWHITRIEDITVNILIADDLQVFTSGGWLDKLGVAVSDTGNAMTASEIGDFSSRLNMRELRNYRMAVGRQTRKVLQGLKPGDMKRKFLPQQLQRIVREGGVLEVPDSLWLIDFWGGKTVAGILQMPVTRHQVVHLNESFGLKKKCGKLV